MWVKRCTSRAGSVLDSSSCPLQSVRCLLCFCPAPDCCESKHTAALKHTDLQIICLWHKETRSHSFILLNLFFIIDFISQMKISVEWCQAEDNLRRIYQQKPSSNETVFDVSTSQCLHRSLLNTQPLDLQLSTPYTRRLLNLTPVRMRLGDLYIGTHRIKVLAYIICTIPNFQSSFMEFWC